MSDSPDCSFPTYPTTSFPRIMSSITNINNIVLLSVKILPGCDLHHEDMASRCIHSLLVCNISSRIEIMKSGAVPFPLI